LYSGEQFDSKIGQQYLRARYYNPATGRFNRLDPFFGNLKDPLSLHKYVYAHNDSINGTDPSGLYFTPIILTLSAIAFGAALYLKGVAALGTVFSPIGATTFIGVNVAIMACANLNFLAFSPLRSQIQGIKFIKHFDTVTEDNVHKEEVKEMLLTLIKTTSQTLPNINWIWNIYRQAIANIWYGSNAPDINQVCGDWVTKVIQRYRERLRENNKENVKMKFAECGITFKKSVWKSILGNNHVTLTLELKDKNNNIEYWQFDDGWTLHWVGSPFKQSIDSSDFIGSEDISVEP
jgi:RHS repeat-associated protein